MAATSIFFRGRIVRTPGHYVDIDASGLEQVGLGATGIVALIGEAEGGRPVAAVTDVQNELIRITRPRQVREIFRSGDLREAAAMTFEPSADEGIVAGAQQIVALKVNPATRSTGALQNSFGSIINLTSADWGAFNDQVNITVANGTTAGKLITIVFEEETESADNVGGTALFQLRYATGSTTWDTMRASVGQSGAVSTFGTRTENGLDNEVTAWTSGPATAEIPANVANAGRLVTVYGLVGSTPTRELLTVSGTATVVGTIAFDEVFGATMDRNAVTSAVVIDETGAGTGTLSIVVGTREAGARLGDGMFVANTNVAVASDATSGGRVQIWGRSTTGAIIGEQLTLTGVANRRRLGASIFSQIDAIVLGDVPNATDDVTVYANVVVSNPSTVQKTIRSLGDLYNGKIVTADLDGDGTPETDVGFTLTFTTGVLDGPVGDLDEIRDVSVTIAAPGASFFGDLAAVLTYLNFQASLLTGVQSTLTNQVDTVTITGLPGSFTYTVTIDGVVSFFTDDGTPTNAEVQAGLIAAINANPGINKKVEASPGATAADVAIATRFGADFVPATSVSANLSVATSTVAVGSKKPPSSQGPLFLSGGSEGVTTFADWQAALNLLKKVRVNTIVPLTGDPAVHAAAEAHCAFMGGIGKSERDCKVGLSALGAGDAPLNLVPSKASIKSQIIDLNSRHVQALAQTVDRFNTVGVRTTFLPWFSASIAAGMQAGSPPGTSMTFKFARVLGFNQHSSWNPVDDAEELIEAGLTFLENVEGVGRRFVRSITTNLSSSNIAFTDVAVNEAVNTATFTFRNALEFAIGEPGFAGTVNALKSRSINTLGLLVDEGVITRHRALAIEVILDVADVSVEIAPTIPINFIKTVVHLVAARLAA